VLYRSQFLSASSTLTHFHSKEFHSKAHTRKMCTHNVFPRSPLVCLFTFSYQFRPIDNFFLLTRTLFSSLLSFRRFTFSPRCCATSSTSLLNFSRSQFLRHEFSHHSHGKLPFFGCRERITTFRVGYCRASLACFV
jgi:hypothetical protein